MPAEAVMVAGDAVRLEQILENLLGNAVKVFAGWGRDWRESAARSLDGIELTVSDAGISLPPGAHERIFEPFGRASNARRYRLPGMGLGLHLPTNRRGTRRAHGRRVTVKAMARLSACGFPPTYRNGQI